MVCEEGSLLVLLNPINTQPLSLSFCSSYIDGSIRYGYRDYTNGLITTAMHILPVLRTDTEEAAIASNCAMNFGAFRDDAEFIHT